MMHIIVSIRHFLNARVKYSGLGKIKFMFSAKRMQISAPRQASVGRSSRRGSGKQKSAYVQRKTYTLIYPYPKYSSLFVWGGEKSLLKKLPGGELNRLVILSEPRSWKIFG